MDMEFIPLIIKLIPTILSLFAILCVYSFYKFIFYILKVDSFVNLYTFFDPPLKVAGISWRTNSGLASVYDVVSTSA